MTQPRREVNDEIMQRREADPRETGPATSGRLPYPNEVIGRKEPPFDVTRVDALSPILMHIDFPATKEDIVAKIGQARIPVDQYHTETVAEILDRVAPNSFRSSTEVEAAVNALYERTRTQRGDDLSGRRPN